MAASQATNALNGICPYFTMFPLDFPLSILAEHARSGERVLDPFCGRGTTNYACRLLGLSSVGIDSNPVAVAIAQAKVVTVTSEAVIDAAAAILGDAAEPEDIPSGEFWEWAFHPEVLRQLCTLRERLMADCRSDARIALRALLMGALHGPRPKSAAAYLSNQSPRTYAPKPGYAVRYWKQRDLRPERVDLTDIIARRARRYFSQAYETDQAGQIVLGDSRNSELFAGLEPAFAWVITSPPYYGMRTYLPDQWLRNWFLGGPPTVDYSHLGQLAHTSPPAFIEQLRAVWINARHVCRSGATLVVRFGAINDRKVAAPALITASLADTGWQITQCLPAGTAARGRRQALHFAGRTNPALDEWDIWAKHLG